MKYIVAVHTGAGNSSHDTNTRFKNLCKTACSHAVELLKNGKSANDAAIAATVILESSTYTNAGVGSSISKDKTIQTEASVCSSVSGFHCVGSLNNVEHPIRIAGFMSNYTSYSDNIVSREYILPRFLVGHGAIDFYLEHSINSLETLGSKDLFTKDSIKRFNRAKEYFNVREKKCCKKRKIENENYKVVHNSLEKHHLLTQNDHKLGGAGICADVSCEENSTKRQGIEDTVGVICIDKDDVMVCTTSSGGSVYKYNGRLGQCCVHGAGSYIQNKTGIVTTGNGEQLINHLIATKVVSNLISNVIEPQHLLKHTLCTSLGTKEKPMSGFLLLGHVEDGIVSINTQHSLHNMVFGFQASSMSSPSARILSRSEDSDVAVFMESVRL